MALLGQVLVIIVMVAILALRWVRPDTWALTFFKILWWLVLVLLAVQSVEFFAAWLLPT